MIVTDCAARLLRDEETLAALGYEPVGFTTADAALSAYRAKPERFDILIVGPLHSPEIPLELATTLHGGAPHLPIVPATRSTEEVRADTLVAAGSWMSCAGRSWRRRSPWRSFMARRCGKHGAGARRH